MKFNRKFIFILIVLLGLFTIFFVGREFHSETGERKMIITTNGVEHFRKGLDVSGGTRLIFKISYDKYEKIYEGQELVAVKQMIEDIILKNIDSRISKLGVSDYKAYVQELDEQPYIVVEIGGIADLDQAKEIIGKTVELEFKIKNPEEVTAKTKASRKLIAQELLQEVVATPDLMEQLTNGRMSENVFYNKFIDVPLNQLPEIYQNNIKILDAIRDGEMHENLIAGTYMSVPSGEDGLEETALNGWTFFHVLEKKEVENASGQNVMVYSIEDVFVQDEETWIAATDDNNTILNGAYFKYANTSASDIGEPVVVINLDDKGKEIFCSVSEKNLGEPMAIFVGGELLTAPTIQSKICGGTAQIDGSFTPESAKELADSLNDGALPAPLILMQEEKISPTLGENTLKGAMRAGLIGFIAIILLVFFVYGLSNAIITAGVLAAFIVVLFGFIKISDYALSLSGIAAIILSIGMAVDANILIFERYREEIKDGKSISGAIDNAKDRSWTAIRDGQISSGIVALLLFTMGINIFKGFGAMMIVCLILTLAFNVPLIKMLMYSLYNKKSK